MASEREYVLLDQASMNQLGEFDTYEEAEETFLRYVGASPGVENDLEIWLDDTKLPVDPEKIRRVTAA